MDSKPDFKNMTESELFSYLQGTYGDLDGGDCCCHKSEGEFVEEDIGCPLGSCEKCGVDGDGDSGLKNIKVGFCGLFDSNDVLDSEFVKHLVYFPPNRVLRVTSDIEAYNDECYKSYQFNNKSYISSCIITPIEYQQDIYPDIPITSLVRLRSADVNEALLTLAGYVIVGCYTKRHTGLKTSKETSKDLIQLCPYIGCLERPKKLKHVLEDIMRLVMIKGSVPSRELYLKCVDDTIEVFKSNGKIMSILSYLYMILSQGGKTYLLKIREITIEQAILFVTILNNNIGIKLSESIKKWKSKF